MPGFASSGEPGIAPDGKTPPVGNAADTAFALYTKTFGAAEFTGMCLGLPHLVPALNCMGNKP